FRYLHASGIRRSVQRREAAVIAGFDVGVGIDQRFGDCRLAGKRRIDQWSLAALVATVYIGALCEERRDLSGIALARGIMKRIGGRRTSNSEPGNAPNKDSNANDPIRAC